MGRVAPRSRGEQAGSTVDPAAIDLRRRHLAFDRFVHTGRRKSVGLVLAAGSGVLALVLAVVAARYLADTPGRLSRGNPGLLSAAAGLSVLGFACKARAWRQLIARHERPRTLALAAANGGASLSALALPGRFDDVVRIAIVRRFGTCPTCVRTLCLSLFMLGMIDTAALAPLAAAAAVLPGHSLGVRLGLALLAGVGFAAAGVVVAMPRLAASGPLLRFRIGRWLHPRTTSLREASQAWVLVSACWLARAAGLLLLLGALGVGFSPTLALFFLCASSAAAALPVGPGGTATQVGAGTAVLIASGVPVSQAVGVAVAVQGMTLLVAGSIFLVATVWRVLLRLASRHQPVTVLALRLRMAGEARR